MDKSKLLRSLTIGQGSLLVPHIDAYHARGKFPDRTFTISAKKEQRDHGDAKIRFSAGSDALLSPRDLYLKHTGRLLEEPISTSLRRSFDVGDFWHQYYQLALIDMGFIDPDNVERYMIYKFESDNGPGYASGLGDLVGVRIPEQGEWLIDIKTMHKQAFESQPSQYLFEKYKAQLNLYGDWFGYDKLMILGVEKDTPHRLREWIITPDSEQLTEIYNKWGYVMRCIEEEIEPN